MKHRVNIVQMHSNGMEYSDAPVYFDSKQQALEYTHQTNRMSKQPQPGPGWWKEAFYVGAEAEGWIAQHEEEMP